MWDIDEIFCDQLYYPILETSPGYILNGKYYPTLLRVIEKQASSLNIRCINFIIDSNNNWKVYSKEKITTDGQFDIYNGYCTDTITKNLGYVSGLVPKDRIDFLHAFDGNTNNIEWICNKSLR